MSEVAEVVEVNPNASSQDQYLQRNSARLEAEYAEKEPPADELDTDGIPNEDVESEAGDDGALAITDNDDDDSDTDGIPDEEESDEGDYEQRFKDTQASLTETSQELSELKTEYSERAGALTLAEFSVEDKLVEAEQVAGFWSNVAQQELQQLHQVQVQGLNQEQYANYQQALATAQQKAGYLNQALENTQKQSMAVKDENMRRVVAASKAELSTSIDNFNEVYPDIGKFAVDSGVNPKVWQEITDPGLVKILYKAMQASAAPDAIETAVTKTKAKKQRTQNLRARDEGGRYKQADKAFRTAKTPRDRKAAYLSREQSRMEREYRR